MLPFCSFVNGLNKTTDKDLTMVLQVMAMIVEGPRATRRWTSGVRRKELPGDPCNGSDSIMRADNDILEDFTSEPSRGQMIFEENGPFHEKEHPGNDGTVYIWQEEALKELLARLNGFSDEALTQRSLLVVGALTLMFKGDVLDDPGRLGAQAMLLHVIALQHCRLLDRPIVSLDCPTGSTFLKHFVDAARFVLLSDTWQTTDLRQTLRCDLADLLDGRLFLSVVLQLQEPDWLYTLGPGLLSSFALLASWLVDTCGVNLNFEPTSPRTLVTTFVAIPQRRVDGIVHGIGAKQLPLSKNAKGPSGAVLPFSNPVIDAHLSSIHLKTSDYSPGNTASRIFRELSHWHNHKRSIDHKVAPAMTTWQKRRIDRRNQLFMAEMRDYAASLTDAVGCALQPEIIILSSSKGRLQKHLVDSAQKSGITSGSQRKEQSNPGGKKKGANINIRDLARAAVMEAQTNTVTRQIEAWAVKRAGFDTEANLVTRFLATKNYLEGLAQNRRPALEAEILTYQLRTLVDMWITTYGPEAQTRNISILGLIWSLILQITRLNQGITAAITRCVANTIDALGLPALEIASVHDQRKLSFQFVDLGARKSSWISRLDPLEFQLVHAGPYFDRNMGSARDHRVHGFEPDRWQRDVLDQIDAKNSVFVVAPTSAGKTFIS